MSLLQDELKAIYQRDNKITPLIEGLEREIPQQTLDDYYVKLKTIIKEDGEKKFANYEAISGRKQEIEVESLFDPLPSEVALNQAAIKRLVVVGGAGTGKSTLLQYIAYKWSKGELWNDKFDYVYRVPLRILLNRNREWDKEDDVLKCLVHYHLVVGLSTQERKGLHLENLAWLDKKDRILLLLDGYDEIAHERNGRYKRLFEDIFDFDNIILSSRPNAIDKEMAERFGRKVENVGFDHDGIDQYLTWYFKDNEEKKKKGSTLEEFLETRPSIRDLCHIPVNIAMICFLWSEGGSNKALKKISNMSDLYHQMVDHLGFRYYVNQPDQTSQDRHELPGKWKGGKIRLDELRVLQYTAYKGLTGGGIKEPDGQISQIHTFPGMIARDDVNGTSIQSSINYLAEQYERSMPAIERVYKYGLLKPDGVLAPASETDLHCGDFRFIHLSFQEFLTAQYFSEKLMERHHEEQEKIASFIALHRNEPQYLMMLKFLAGILSSKEGYQAEKAMRIFWDAIMCNPDGVLEFGVETKVTLLMHLLSQTMKEDKRIPNRDVAMRLIDSVVLRDLAGWRLQLRETYYTSQNIQNGLIECFVKNNIAWLSEKSLELQNNQSPKIEITNTDASKITFEGIIDLLDFMIDKFEDDQQNQILSKAVEQLTKWNDMTEWLLTKKAIELIVSIHRKTNFNIGIQQETEILNFLLLTANNENFDAISYKALEEIIRKPQNSKLIHLVTSKVKSDLQTINSKMQYPKTLVIANIVLIWNLHDIQIVKSAINALVLFLEHIDWKVRISASATIFKLLRIIANSANSTNSDIEFIKQTIQHFIPLRSLQTNEHVSILSNIKDIIEITCKSRTQMITDILVSSTPYLDIQLRSNYPLASKIFVELIMIIVKKSSQPIQDAVETFNQFFNGFPFYLNLSSLFSDMIGELGKRSNLSGLEFIEKVLSISIQQLQTSHLFRNSAITPIIEFIRKRNNRAQLSKYAIEKLTSNLLDPKLTGKDSILDTIAELIDMSDKNDYGLMMNLLSELKKCLKDSNWDDQHDLKDKVIEVIIQVMNFKPRDASDCQLAELILNELSKLILNELSKQSGQDLKEEISERITDLMQVIQTSETKLFKRALGLLIDLLEGSNEEVKDSASKNIVYLVSESGESQKQLIKHAFVELNTLLKKPGHTEQNRLAKTILNIIKVCGSTEKQLAKDIFRVLAPRLKDTNQETKQEAFQNIVMVMELISGSDDEFTLDILEHLTPIFVDSFKNVTSLAFSPIQMFVKMKESSKTEFVKSLINALLPLLKNNDGYLRRVAYYHIGQLMKVSQISETEKNYFLTSFNLLLYDKWFAMSETSWLIIKLLWENKKNDDDNELFRQFLNAFVFHLKNPDSFERRFILRRINKLMELSGVNKIEFLQDALKVLISMVSDSQANEISTDIILLVKKSLQGQAQLLDDVFKDLRSLLTSNDKSVRNAASKVLIELKEIYGVDDPDLFKRIFQILTALLEDSTRSERDLASSNIVKLVKLYPEFLEKTIDIAEKLLKHQRLEFRHTASQLLKVIVQRVLISLPDELLPYFNHFSKDFRKILVSCLFDCLEKYIQKFELLEQLFQNPKVSITPDNIKSQFFNNLEKLDPRIQKCIEDLQNNNLSSMEYAKLLSELKSLLVSELNHINDLRGPQIIELAMIVIAKQKTLEDVSDHKNLIEFAQGALDIQLRYLNEEGLTWMEGNFERLNSLPLETKPFFRKVCHKLLEDEKLTPLKQKLLIKFINQGLTHSITRKGEIIFEGKRYNLQGENIEQSFEKIAKAILDQSQDTLVRQYKEHEPIFPKSDLQEGMKKAAIDFKEVKSLVDKRRKLKTDSWLLTQLKSPNFAVEIIILEKRTAFGDHLVLHLTGNTEFRFEPNKTSRSQLEEVFGFYVIGQYYEGEIQELIHEAGQNLYESKDVNLIPQIQGENVSNQIYFQQNLLGEGSEDANQAIREDLAKKLNDNRAELAYEIRNLSDSEKRSIHEYYDGFVSTISSLFTASQAIVSGQVSVYFGKEFLSPINIVILVTSLTSWGFPSGLSKTIETIRRYFQSTEIKQKAEFVSKIAIDAVELNGLLGKTARKIISNRIIQQIDLANDQEQANNLLKKVKELAQNLFKKFEQTLFVEKIENLPAFRLGVSHASQVIQGWIKLLGSKSEQRPKSFDEKLESFVNMIVGSTE